MIPNDRSQSVPPLLLRLAAVVAIAAGAACTNDVVDGSAMGFELNQAGEDDQALQSVCAPNERLRGIDVSVFQGSINWSRVAQDNVHYAFIRVSDGLNTPDVRFAENWAGAKAAGVRRGVYQFFRPSQDPIAQANLLISAVGTLEPGDLPPVIDVETRSGQSRATVQGKIQTWMTHVEQRLGVKPIIYTGPYFWRDEVRAPTFARTAPLWVAHYTSGCPLVPEPWGHWTFHQFTDQGRVAGIGGPVDINFFRGGAAALAALAVQPTEPEPPVVVDDPESAFLIDLPIGGSTVDNPVQFEFQAENIRTVHVFAGPYPILDFHPEEDGLSHSVYFFSPGRRELRVAAYNENGERVFERFLSVIVRPAPSREAGIARDLLQWRERGEVEFFDRSFDVFDDADALANIVDTAADRPARRSCYGTAPCGSVYLSRTMLEAMRAIKAQYNFNTFYTAISGAEHSFGSLHYAGRAFDIDEINGVRIVGPTSATASLMNACWALGASEVFGPNNDPFGHADHIHCGF